MRFDDEPFHNTRGCGFWFRLPRRRWGHAGCAFLKSRVFFYSEAFTFFGRMFERRDREFVTFDRLSAAKLFDYVLDERYAAPRRAKSRPFPTGIGAVSTAP